MGEKKKSRDARHSFCMLLRLGCAFCLLVMSGAGARSGVNDSSKKAWGSHLVSGSCRGNLLVQDPQLFLKHALLLVQIFALKMLIWIISISSVLKLLLWKYNLCLLLSFPTQLNISYWECNQSEKCIDFILARKVIYIWICKNKHI